MREEVSDELRLSLCLDTTFAKHYYAQQHDNLFRALHLQDSKIRRPLLLGNLVASLGVLLVAKELRIHLRG